MTKFFTKDCPEKMPVITWLKNNTDWASLMTTVKPVNDIDNIIRLRIRDFNAVALNNSITEILSLYGEHGWNSSEGEHFGYSGFSIVYNPNHQDGLDQHSSTLGTPKNSSSQFFWNSTQNHTVLKNSYYDTYGFTTLTQASKHGVFGDFLKRCKSTVVRSRLSIINDQIGCSWHRDESIFENLRINIPITTTPHHLFQIENQAPLHLNVGWGYSWDTNIPHRVFSNSVAKSARRIHVVLGFSPWWNYNPEEQSWDQNEFYGKKHPFDMLIDGDIFNGLELDRTT